MLFGNPTYGNTFRAFSLSRLFTPVGSNITEASFSIPGTNGTVRHQSEVSARCSQMLINQMALDLALEARASSTSTGTTNSSSPVRSGVAGPWKLLLLRDRV